MTTSSETYGYSAGLAVQRKGISEDMARGRFLSESVARDIRLNSLSVEAQLVYLMAVPHLDRDGLIDGDAEVLFGTVCPKRRILIDRMGEFIKEWESVGLVTLYDGSEGQVLWFRGFAKNQVGMRYEREAPSKFPPPPGHMFTELGITPDELRTNSGLTPDELRTNSGSCRAQVQGQVQVQEQVQVEVKGECSCLSQVQQEPTEVDSLTDDIPAPRTKACATKPARRSIQKVEPTSLTPQQEFFGAICEAVGWDYHVITDDNKKQVAQTVGILRKGDYTVDDVRRYMVEVWFKDWRWVKNQQYPSLTQLRQGIGQIRSIVPSMAPAAPKKGLDRYHEMLRERGIGIGT